MNTENFIRESDAPDAVKEKSLNFLPAFSLYKSVWRNTEKSKNAITFYFSKGEKTIQVGVYGERANSYIDCDNLNTDENFAISEPCSKVLELAFRWLEQIGEIK